MSNRFFRGYGGIVHNVVAANANTVLNPLDGFDLRFWSAPTFADIDEAVPLAFRC
jgi:hypothetical protein